MNEAIGFQTMSTAMADVRHYYDWLYYRIRPFLGNTPLEIGPGFGNIAERIIQDGKRYLAIDTNSEVITHLASRFPLLSANQLIVGDITAPAPLAQVKAQHPDCILSMNVLEHIQDDSAHVKTIAAHALAPPFVFVVPTIALSFGRF